MTETELKFQVPPAALPAVRRAVATASARRSRLQARYYDTPQRELAAAGFALRLRREDGGWVQTLKGRGDGVMQRLEHNAEVAGDGEPTLDLARHAGTPAGDALAAAGIDLSALAPLFVTDIGRTHRRLRHGGAVVEIALDEGVIAVADDRVPVCELEFELVSGAPQALLALAFRWVQRHRLWLDVRTKAERGDLLARGLACSPPAKASAPLLTAHDAPAAALRAMVRACLEQVLSNASTLAAGRAEPEHVHQLRVGLRRLRTALRVFGDASPEIDARWEPALSLAFGRLGAARDLDALRVRLLPALRAAGAPLASLQPPPGADEPGASLREPAWSLLMLELLGFALAPTLEGEGTPWALPAADDGALRRWVRDKLRRAHRQAVAGARSFATLEEPAQHRVRKRVKRLRYSVEFVSSLYPAKAVEAYLRRLRPAQEALGEYNDVLVARAAFDEQLTTDARAWFALGWLARERELLLGDCTRSLRRLAKAAPFWKRR